MVAGHLSLHPFTGSHLWMAWKKPCFWWLLCCFLSGWWRNTLIMTLIEIKYIKNRVAAIAYVCAIRTLAVIIINLVRPDKYLNLKEGPICFPLKHWLVEFLSWRMVTFLSFLISNKSNQSQRVMVMVLFLFIYLFY